MSTENQKNASRINGARSVGPVTPQGKRKSALNSLRHSLLAGTVVLDGESNSRFHTILFGLVEEFQPATTAQVMLVQNMATARWRQLRIWDAQKAVIDRDVELQDSTDETYSLKVVIALKGNDASACPLELLHRYDISYDRQFHRSLNQLLVLQSLPASPKPESGVPEPPHAATWKAESRIAERTQEAIERKRRTSARPTRKPSSARPKPASPYSASPQNQPPASLNLEKDLLHGPTPAKKTHVALEDNENPDPKLRISALRASKF